ncbi:hypothetical protein [Haloarcula sp. CBA1131]|uniref:hypothetical protein n=1 Tax=Haloarcula sp. CBA1131 TaxID=1853686 RepID=UPI001245B245|nr:hypothetical protein [Haloarcula sp. CBA1131]
MEDTDWESIEFEHMSICLMEYSDEEQRKANFEEIVDIGPFDGLGSRFVEKSPSSKEDNYIVIASDAAEDIESAGMENDQVYIDFDSSDEGLHIHIDIISIELIKSFSNVLSAIGEIVDEIEVRQVVVEIEHEEPFSNFEFPPIQRVESEFQFNGLRFSKDDLFHAVQDLSEMRDNDATGYRRVDHRGPVIGQEGAEKLIQEELSQAREFLEGLKK